MSRNNNYRSSRRSGRSGGRGGGRRSNTSTSRNSNTSKPKEESKKTLQDYQFNVGSAKHASEYVSSYNYIVNHIKMNYNRPGDIGKALEELEEFDFTPFEPVLKTSTNPDPNLGARENKQYEKQFEVDYAEHKKRVDLYESNKTQAEALIWNQCSSTLKSKVMSRKDYYTTVKGDPIKLLKAIKEHAMSYESTQYRMKTICDALKNMLNMKQREDESTIDYLRRFKAARDVFYSHVGKNFVFPRTVEDDKEYKDALQEYIAATDDAGREAATDKAQKARVKSMDQFLSYLFLENSDRLRFGSILSGLDTQFSLNNDQYPKTLLDAQNVVSNHKWDDAYKQKRKSEQ